MLQKNSAPLGSGFVPEIAPGLFRFFTAVDSREGTRRLIDNPPPRHLAPRNKGWR